MIDNRFYRFAPPVYLADLVEQTGAELVKGDVREQVHTVSALSNIQAGVFSFARSMKSLPAIPPTGGVVIAAASDVIDQIRQWPIAVLRHAHPDFAFSSAARKLIAERDFMTSIADHADFHETVQLGAGVVIAPGVEIGKGTQIGPNATIGCGVHIGENCTIGPNVHLGFCDVGDHVKISPGVVIGGNGLGVATGDNELADIPHFGSVEIGNNVTIGSNTTIDRGVFSATKIGNGTRIDNLVQIAHNVVIGENCIFAAHVGISGSVTIGNRVLMGGKVGITDHRTIGDDAVIVACSATMRNVPANETWSGTPAQPLRQHMREVAFLRKLLKDHQESKST